jgi:hypothetical protein
MVHIYVAVRKNVMSRQSLIITIINSWRMFKEERFLTVFLRPILLDSNHPE